MMPPSSALFVRRLPLVDADDTDGRITQKTSHFGQHIALENNIVIEKQKLIAPHKTLCPAII
ncbi:hypothetical protein WT49_04260 [Burkholderia territorii]|nr:hypothetical protein WT50_29600 [Burkholderia territorii]KWE42148.1 hypothetical protein WT49_04260 [Burkholderia territorii]KWE43817.1 hypothetical protein WT51_22655 [Burkholderia territorii]